MTTSNDDKNKVTPKETTEELAEQAESGDPKKGYNEQNPAQEGGAFEPDTKDENTSDEPPKADDL
jgi:hypothetical protein